MAPSSLWSNRAWKISLGGVPRLRYLRVALQFSLYVAFDFFLSHLKSYYRVPREVTSLYTCTIVLTEENVSTNITTQSVRERSFSATLIR